MDNDHKVIRLTPKSVEDLLTSALEIAERQDNGVLAYLIKMALLEARTAAPEMPIRFRARNPS